MKVFSLLTIVVFGSYIYTGLYVLYVNPKSIVNRLYFIMSLCLAGYTFCGVYALSSDTVESILKWHKGGMYFVVVFFALTLQYFTALTRPGRTGPVLLGLIYLPVPFLFYFNATSSLLYSNFIKTGEVWAFVSSYDSFTYFIYIVYVSLYNILYLILVAGWGKKTVFKRQKMQARMLFITLAIGYFAGMLEEILLPSLSPYSSHALSAFFFIIPMLAALFATVRTRFMAITLEYVSEEIVNTIDEAIILLDPDFRILVCNTRAEVLLSRSGAELTNRRFADIVADYGVIAPLLYRMMNDGDNGFPCRLEYSTDGGRRVLTDNTFAKVLDKKGEIIGVLIVSREVKELEQLKIAFNITPRETEIIRCIAAGYSNREMCGRLSLSESTIKTHLLNIFRKLEVKNKLQLLHVLQEFTLTPEESE